MFMLSTRTSIFLGVLLLIYAIGRTFAGDQVATFTQIEGDVKVFTHPSKTLPKNLPESSGSPHALFEGEYYQVKSAQLGDNVNNGNIVRTAPNARARVVFPNGDQINVGPGSAYRTFWKEQAASNQQPQWNLMYGKVRGVIERGGPRSTLRVKTKTAIMGVRGTDFYISENGQDGTTEVSILRGAVEIKSLAPKAKPATVETGYSAAITPPLPVPQQKTKTLAMAPTVELRKTTQEDLISIQKSSKIAKETTQTSAPPAAVQEQIRTLESKATQTVLKDIKLHDTQLYAKLSKDPNASAQELNQASVSNIMKDAPKAPSQQKPSSSDFENLEKRPYDQYFKSREE